VALVDLRSQRRANAVEPVLDAGALLLQQPVGKGSALPPTGCTRGDKNGQ